MSDTTVPPLTKPPRRKRRRFGLWLILSGVLFGIAITGLVASATGLSVRVPDWATRKLEDRINAEFDAGRISVRDVALP